MAATTAFNTTEQVAIPRLVKFLSASVPIELLRQQVGRTNVHAGAAADAGQYRQFRSQLRRAGGEQAIGGLGHRRFVAVQGETHHRPAHDQPFDTVPIAAALLNQFGEGRPDQYFEIAGPVNLSSDGDHAGNHRLAAMDGTIHGVSGGDVEALHPNIDRQSVHRRFPARQ